MSEESNQSPKNESSAITLAAGLTLPLERIVELMSKGEIQEAHGRLRWSSNYTFLVSICQEDTTLKAIYKPQRGERPLWDFPDGTLCYRETAAFILSEAIKWRIVPPTILRNGLHGLGSVQCYIEHNADINYFSLDNSYDEQLRRFTLFDYITNNADRKGGHCLLGPNNRLWGIDHGICFHAVPKLRTVIWNFAGKAISENLLDEIRDFHNVLCDESSPLHEQLGKLISEREVQATLSRTKRLLNTGKYPQPGHGPSYPWPPV